LEKEDPIRHEALNSTPTGKGSRIDAAVARELADFMRRTPAVVLSGAGCSTESGIPDYRGPDGRMRTRSPIRIHEFVGNPRSRIRYWARSMVGWPRFRASRPNAAHGAIAALERGGFVRGVITQNVDGLHQAAGSRRVVDLHGRLSKVRCLECGDVTERDDLQRRLTELNPDFDTAPRRFVADGDAELPAGSEHGFHVPGCVRCGGMLKPDVVFFGENVPKDRLRRTWEVYERGEALLVVGSSLTVFSGRRFVLRATKERRPVAIANLGPTRGDDAAALRVEGRLGEVLPLVASELLGSGWETSAHTVEPATQEPLPGGERG